MAHSRAFAASLLLVCAAYPAYLWTNRPQTAKAKAAKAQATAAKSTRTLTSSQGQLQQWLSGMSLRHKVAQLIVLTTYGEAPSSRSKAFQDYVKAVRDLRVGGLIVVNRVVSGSVRPAEPYAMAAFLNRMQRLAKVPLLVGADFERGASMRVTGTSKFPHLMAYGAANDVQLTRGLGSATAREARALGVHWVFAPVADVNNNPDNPIINIRSFGEDPQLVATHVAAFIEGVHSDAKNRVLATVKHFPGHGDTNVDTHIGLATLGANRARMDSIELVPFRRAVDAGVDAVMTAHLAVPAVEPAKIPATVSKNILSGLLRDELKFGGLIVTDAMDMQGLTNEFPGGEASVHALIAGVDVLLMPPDVETAINAVVDAVRKGRITQKRIDESVARVLAAKLGVGLHKNKLVNLDEINDVIESPELAELAQESADKAITLVKNESNAVPLKNPDESCVFVLAESRFGQQGRRLMEEFRRRSKKIKIVLADPEITKSELEQHAADASACDSIIIAAFITVGAYRGDVALRGNYPAFVQSLMAKERPVVMIALGSPYLLRSFPRVDSYIATFSPAVTAETAAVKSLFGEIHPRGRLPVTIPGVAKIGDGVELTRE